jgi:SAM-dependent methyltransferase
MKKNKELKIRQILRDGETISFQNGIFTNRPGKGRPISTAGQGLVANLQDILKRYGPLYYRLIQVFSSVTPTREFNATVDKVLRQHGHDAVIVNVGSGPNRFMGREDIINLDLFDFKEVDICVEAHDIPLRDDSVDLIICISALEHVADPWAVVAEMQRICKHGGTILCAVPFMQPFHAAPHDYHRFSIEALKLLFDEWRDVKVGICAGPTSGMLWILVEWLALTLSFGNTKIRDILYLTLMVVTSPLKYLDKLLSTMEVAKNIASVYYVLAVK